jgi:WD40 repeat protein
MNTRFDPAKAKLTAEHKHPTALYALCHDPEHQHYYTAGADGAVYAFSPQQPDESWRKVAQVHDNYIAAAVYRAGTIISAGFDRCLAWTDAASGEVLRRIEAHDGWVRNVALFPDGTTLASVGDDMLLKLWDAETGQLRHTFQGHATQTPQGFATALYAVAVSRDGRYVATADRIGDIRVWDLNAGQLAARLSAPAFYTYDPVKRARSLGGIRAVCFSSDTQRLAVSGIGAVSNVDGFVGPCRVELWDWRAAKRLFAGQDDHKAVLNDVAFCDEDARLLAAGGGDSGGIVAFWDLQEPKPAKLAVKGHVHRAVLEPQSLRLVLAGSEGVQVYAPPAEMPSGSPAAAPH